MIVYKLFAAGEYNKREEWVNKMCRKGYALKKFGLVRYEFEKCEPGEYYYDLELLENLTCHPENQDYIYFLRDEWDIEYVDSNSNWAFFRRKSTGGKFTLFSNNENKYVFLKRILTFRTFIIFLLLILAITNILLSKQNYNNDIFSILGFLGALFILVANIPNWVRLHKLQNLIRYNNLDK